MLCKGILLALEIFLFIRYYSCVYFHTISRADAEKKLRGTETGTFLIRASKPGTYTLSVTNGVNILHYRINNESNKYYISEKVVLPSLNELVHHHMLQADGLCCSLTVPITKPVNIPTTQDMWEIKKSSIEFLKCLTAGEFGEIWKANLFAEVSSVMIKTNIATNIPQETFLNEANILKKLSHDNIIHLHGVCTKEYPFYIVTELMENGNLQAYLNHHNKMGWNLTPSEIIDIAVQVANGMIYLGEQDYIHCDLRAENILVGEYNTIKIANFHSARHLNGNRYWSVEKGIRFATRWTAPECYTSKRLSIKSDVWSFGILLWELVTKGRAPYPDMTNEQVHEAVPQGYHMRIPKDCPEPFYQIMLDCWKLNDDERTTFNNICRHLLGETA